MISTMRGWRRVVKSLAKDFSRYINRRLFDNLRSIRGEGDVADLAGEKKRVALRARARLIVIRDYYRARFAWSRGLNDYKRSVARKIRSIAAWGRVRTVDSDRPRLRSLAREGQAYRLTLRTSLLSWCRLRDNDPTIVAPGARLVAFKRSGRSSTASLRFVPHRTTPVALLLVNRRNRRDGIAKTPDGCVSRDSIKGSECTRIACANV